MAALLAPVRQTPGHQADIRTLEPDDVSQLRLTHSQSTRELRREIARYPGRSVWTPDTLEFVAVVPWRNRPEIACVSELVAVRHAEALLQAAFDRCCALGADLFLALELESQRSLTRYERAGLLLLEEVITYEMQTPRELWRPQQDMRMVPVHAQDVNAVSLMTTIDREAFPWLWQNSQAEFDAYLCTPGVEAALIVRDDRPVAYFGLTHFAGWGHLDRIAVHPAFQGAGIGLSALRLAVDAMRRRGARRIGLSTQRTNRRSQRLYERFGFRRTFDNDYRLYGRWTSQELKIDEASV